jgi:hypothetical protein
MSIRLRIALTAVAALVAALVVVLLLRGGEEERPEGRIAEGGSGFSLRGSLASDEAAIAAAVRAWRDPQGREDDEDGEAARATPDPLGGRRPGRRDDVAVLWAGNVDRFTDVAILQSDELVAALERRPDGEWHVEGESLHDRFDTTGVPVGAGDWILTPAGQWRAVRVGRGSGPEQAGDGLFRADGVGDEGFVLPEYRGRAWLGLYVVGVGGRLIESGAVGALEAAIADGQGRAVWQAASAAQQPVTEELEDATATRELQAAPKLEVVWTGRVEGRPHAAVVAQASASRRALALGFGDVPGEDEIDDEAARDADKAGSALLGYGRVERGRERAILGGAYVELDNFTYLVVGGRDVESLHVLVGDRAFTRRGPVAVLDARAFDPEVDTVFYGRGADGSVVAPLTAP